MLSVEPLVTRIEIVSDSGRVYTGYFEPGARVALQDDGRTMKVFVGAEVPASTVYSKG